MLRIGVLHHNARRKAKADNENLRDEDDLTNILGDQLDLLLHGHTHEGKEDRLADGTLVLATGSAAVTADWRPGEVREPVPGHQAGARSGHQVGAAWDGQRQPLDRRRSRQPPAKRGRCPDPLATPGWDRGQRPVKRPTTSTVARSRRLTRDDFAEQVRPSPSSTSARDPSASQIRSSAGSQWMATTASRWPT